MSIKLEREIDLRRMQEIETEVGSDDESPKAC
jgi:hypothetical protein